MLTSHYARHILEVGEEVVLPDGEESQQPAVCASCPYREGGSAQPISRVEAVRTVADDRPRI